MDYKVLGAIKLEVFEELILCFTQSAAVKRKFNKRLMAEDLTPFSPKAI